MAEVTLGGDRLGSGNKQKVELHNYGMNSFNLEQDFKSSMAPGILYPFMQEIGTNHGTFDIDLDTFVRTLPTKGPLFGSFKLQADVFCVPIRLYQGILHNNPVGIGLKMNQVYLPKLKVETVDGLGAMIAPNSNKYNCQVNESSLLKYFGISGLGHQANQNTRQTVGRKFNAIPILAYYDIFKCYYSNKQEENAYVITPGDIAEDSLKVNGVIIDPNNGTTEGYTYIPYNELAWKVGTNGIGDQIDLTLLYKVNYKENFRLTDEIKESILETQKIAISFLDSDNHEETADVTISDWMDNGQIDGLQWSLNDNALADPNHEDVNYTIQLSIQINKLYYDDDTYTLDSLTVGSTTINLNQYTSEIQLTPFKLANIDDMRNALLSANTLGAEFVLGSGESDNWNTRSGSDETGYPYSALFKTTTDGITWNAFAQNGLVVKTYQSDLFNNWLDTEFIDGEHGISAISAVDTSTGKFTMDTLNLAEKIYELLNRVLVSGGTYEDWQEAVYGEGAVRKAETPMYIGGMAAEIMFEEVISNSETNIKGDFQPLGSLGGKGTQTAKRGGNNIHVKCDEPSYVIGIVSITPRISYSQGNRWDMTELDTLDDLHKPALDGIGFQELMVEQMAWWNTVITPNSTTILHRDSVGKQTAWINYQTAVDRCYGDFAKVDGYSFMVLNRNYEMGNTISAVKDLTTYIDPAKFNYAFAVTNLAAQNFWVQIHSKVIARRKMGAQQIPNL